MENFGYRCGDVWICCWLSFSSRVCGMGQVYNRMKKENNRVFTSAFSRHRNTSAKLDQPPNYVTHQILSVLPIESLHKLFLRRRLSPESNTLRESRWILSHNFVDCKIVLFISLSADKYERMQVVTECCWIREVKWTFYRLEIEKKSVRCRRGCWAMMVIDK